MNEGEILINNDRKSRRRDMHEESQGNKILCKPPAKAGPRKRQHLAKAEPETPLALTDPNAVRIALAKAVAECNKHDVLTLARHLRDIAPRMSYGYLLPAQFYRETGEYEKARRLVEEAIASLPPYSGFIDALGRIALAKGNLNEAQAHYKDMVRQWPQAAAGYTNLAHIFARLKLYDDALSVLNQGAQVLPENPTIFLALGHVHGGRGDSESAIVAYRHALDLDPQHAGASTSLVTHLMRQKRYHEAGSILLTMATENRPRERQAAASSDSSDIVDSTNSPDAKRASPSVASARRLRHFVLSTDSLSLPRPWFRERAAEEPKRFTRFRETYPYILERRLAEIFAEDEVRVTNLSTRASQLSQAYSHRYELFACMESAVSIIHCGIVDCWPRENKGGLPNSSLEQFRASYQTVLDQRARMNPTQPLIVVGIAPTNAHALSKNRNINDLVAKYNSVFKENMDASMRYIDMERAVFEIGEHLLHPDGHHLSRDGHLLVARELTRSVVDLCI